MPEPTPKTRGGFVFPAAAMLLSTIVALALGECAARLVPERPTFEQGIRQFRDAAIEPDGVTGWHIRPGAAVAVHGISYRFSSLGARGADLDPMDTRPTLLVVGDSVTLGWGVREADTFTAQLAQPDGEQSWQTVNAAVIGYGIDQDLGRLEQLLPLVKPQAVLLGYYPNDPEGPESTPGLGGPRWSRLWALVAPGLNSLFVKAGASQTATQHHRALHEPGSAGWQRVVTGYARLSRICADAHVPCGVLLLPELQTQPYPLADVHERLAAEARQNGLAVLDLAPTVAGLTPQSLWVAPDDSHPNAEGHHRYAAAIRKFLPSLVH